MPSTSYTASTLPTLPLPARRMGNSKVKSSITWVDVFQDRKGTISFRPDHGECRTSRKGGLPLMMVGQITLMLVHVLLSIPHSLSIPLESATGVVEAGEVGVVAVRNANPPATIPTGARGLPLAIASRTVYPLMVSAVATHPTGRLGGQQSTSLAPWIAKSTVCSGHRWQRQQRHLSSRWKNAVVEGDGEQPVTMEISTHVSENW